MFKIDLNITKIHPKMLKIRQISKIYCKTSTHDKKCGSCPQNPTAGPQTYWAPRAQVPQQFAALISLAFIVVSALYAKSSSCKIVRKVGKVQEITHLDQLNQDESANTIKDRDKDTVICDCGERQMFTVFEIIVVATLLVLFLYVIVSKESHC